MRPNIKLEPPDTRFISPGGNLRCMSMFQATTSYKKKKYSFPVYAIRENGKCLLGCPEAVEMSLVKHLDEVSDVFRSSGLLKTESVRIARQEDAQPYAVQTLCSQNWTDKNNGQCQLLSMVPAPLPGLT